MPRAQVAKEPRGQGAKERRANTISDKYCGISRSKVFPLINEGFRVEERLDDRKAKTEGYGAIRRERESDPPALRGTLPWDSSPPFGYYYVGFISFDIMTVFIQLSCRAKEKHVDKDQIQRSGTR
jgi:hypothetical protein